MKITKGQLRQIIREELLREAKRPSKQDLVLGLQQAIVAYPDPGNMGAHAQKAIASLDARQMLNPELTQVIKTLMSGDSGMRFGGPFPRGERLKDFQAHVEALVSSEGFKERISSLADKMADKGTDMLLSPDLVPSDVPLLAGGGIFLKVARSLARLTRTQSRESVQDQAEELEGVARILRKIASDAYDRARMEMSGRGLYVGPAGDVVEPT
tara:strand:+ start:239 stop:874 length:636 start_codon:yes stop_codon:yes gene_type:complete